MKKQQLFSFNRTILNDTLYELRWTYCGLTRVDAAKIFGVTEKTFKKWEESHAPGHVGELLYHLAGFLPAPFDGWRITQGMLWTPENAGYTPGEIQAIHWDKQLIQFQRAEIRELKEALQDAGPDLSNVIPFPKPYKKG